MARKIAGDFSCKDARVKIDRLGKPGMYIAVIEPWRGDPKERSNLSTQDVRDIKERYGC